MSKPDLKVELVNRYCPHCRTETNHASLVQMFFGRRGRVGRQEELASACAICNPDRFWGLKLTTEFDPEKFLAEHWMPKSS